MGISDETYSDLVNRFWGIHALDDADHVVLVKHKKRRKKPVRGDLFALEVKDHGWYAGRVIKEQPSDFPGDTGSMWGDVYLVYIYKHKYDECPVSFELPMAPELLTPPLVLDSSFWSKGIFVPMGHSVLEPSEVLGSHCFWSSTKQVFFNDVGEVLDEPVRPCDSSGVTLIEGLPHYLARSIRDGFDQDNHPLN